MADNDPFANLTLQSFEHRIGRNCTDRCSLAATNFFGYMKGTHDIRNLTREDVQKSGEGQDEGLDDWFHDELDREWDVPVYKLVAFIWYCTNSNFIDYTLGQAADWFTEHAINDAGLERLVNYTLNACPTQFCRSLTWEGNPDVSGVGVNAAFVVQAVLTSLFLLFYFGFYIADVVYFHSLAKQSGNASSEQGNSDTTDHQQDIQQDIQAASKKPNKRLDRNAVRETADACLEVFWSTCYIFAFTFVVSALIFNVDASRSAGRIYSGYFSYLGAVHSIAALICLWPWFPGRYKYPVLTFSGMFVLLCMMTGVSVSFFNETKLTGNKTTFEARCLEAGQSTHYVQGFVKYTPYAVFALILVWGGSLLIIRLRILKMTGKGGQKPLEVYLILTGIFGGLLVLTSLALLWLSMGFFIYLRQKVAELAGYSYKEDEWGFGQVVAVVAWLPLLGQFSGIVARGLAKLLPFDGAHELVKPVPKDQRSTARVLAQELCKREEREEKKKQQKKKRNHRG